MRASSTPIRVGIVIVITKNFILQISVSGQETVVRRLARRVSGRAVAVLHSSPTIGSPAVMRPLAAPNEGKPFGQQLKPFNFLLTCHVRAFGYPSGADAERFHLIAP